MTALDGGWVAREVRTGRVIAAAEDRWPLIEELRRIANYRPATVRRAVVRFEDGPLPRPDRRGQTMVEQWDALRDALGGLRDAVWESRVLVGRAVGVTYAVFVVVMVLVWWLG